MKFSVFDVMDKGLYLKQALETAGHTETPFSDDPDLLLLDCDWEWALPRPQLIDQAVDRGIRVALYPHGGQPTAFAYDGLTKPHSGVDLRLEHGVGSVSVGDLTGHDLHQEATGWLYCPTADFEPVQDPYRILFAPLHPNIEAMQKGLNGGDPAPKLNRHVYQQLLKLGLDITVSVVGPLWKNGIWFHPSATLASNPEMRFTGSYGLVQQADLVIGAGTIAAAAVACGKPLVAVGDHDACDYIGGKYKRSIHADQLDEWFRYPLNAEDGDLESLVQAACAGSPETAAWRDRWIGRDGTENAVRLLEALGSPSSASVTIEGATARSGANA